MTALFSHSKVRVFLGVSTLLGVVGIVLQALGVFTQVDLVFLGGYTPLAPNIFVDSGFLLFWAIVPGLCLLSVGVGAGLMLVIVLWGGYLSLVFWVGQPYQLALPIMAACSLALVSIARALDWRGTFLDREQEDINVLFGGFLEPQILRGFTTMSERLTPQETVSMLNDYFSVMVDIIFDYGGVLDKYICDALLAVFGAPFSTGEDPDRAVKTAIDMLAALGRFNQQRAKERKEPINIGIGISTDKILSGNIGSLKRMDYTVIGDGVNLASRLEDAIKSTAPAFWSANLPISN